MILPILLAASLSFEATATGLEKGAPVEFIFAGRNSDRDYESMFLLEESVDELCARFEKAGIPRGRPEDTADCRFWPVGCELSFEPPIDEYIVMKQPEGLSVGKPVYTGGSRTSSGKCRANDVMPASFFSIYSLAQSPIVFDGIIPQGVIYGSITAKQAIKKGTKVTFRVSCQTNSMPRHLSLCAKPGKSLQLVRDLRTQAAQAPLDVTVSFDPSMTVKESTDLAKALSTIDSQRVKLNGKDNLFYRTFVPDAAWLDRKTRLQQPFELTLGPTNSLVYIAEDWSGEGMDPKLLPKEISFSEACKYPKTDTCFIFTSGETSVSEILKAMDKLSAAKIRNWYVFGK